MIQLQTRVFFDPATGALRMEFETLKREDVNQEETKLGKAIEGFMTGIVMDIARGQQIEVTVDKIKRGSRAPKTGVTNET